MDRFIKKARFVTSVADQKQIPDYDLPEIAIAGKSNVGKSSFINFITNHGGLAKTSAEPGRTRLLNYFLINDSFYFVDLPGYGFARVSDAEKRRWGNLIEGYLLNGKNLKNVFVLVDIRHSPGEHDKQMLQFLYYYNIPFTVVLTKMDKLSNNEIRKMKQVIATELRVGIDNLIPVSSSKKLGADLIDKRLLDILS